MCAKQSERRVSETRFFSLSLFSLLDCRQVKVVLAPPDEDLHRRVGGQADAELVDLGLDALGQLPVVVEQREDQGDLDLVGREEPARAGVDAVAEAIFISALNREVVPGGIIAYPRWSGVVDTSCEVFSLPASPLRRML